MLIIRLTIQETPTELSVALELDGSPPVRDREVLYSADLLAELWKALKKTESETPKPLLLSGHQAAWAQAANLPN
jgi:hypothetical protein